MSLMLRVYRGFAVSNAKLSIQAVSAQSLQSMVYFPAVNVLPTPMTHQYQASPLLYTC